MRNTATSCEYVPKISWTTTLEKIAESVAWTVALNPEPGTPNPEPRTWNRALRIEPEHEPGTENPEE